MKGLTVQIVYRNEKMETVSTEKYSLQEYSDLLKNDQHRIISDVESLVYQATKKPREEWDDNVWSAFIHIRHKLLDKAGEIGRLHENVELID